MARSGMKRRRVPSPPPFFVSETPAQSQVDPFEEDQDKQSTIQTMTSKHMILKAPPLEAHKKNPQNSFLMNLGLNGQSGYIKISSVCSGDINRPTYDNSTTNLLKHVATCLKRQNEKTKFQKLGAEGVTGTGDITPRDMCVIVIDNASNNKTMIGAIKKYKRAQFKGKGQWVRCFAHILTLIAQVIWHPFGSHKKKTQSNSASHKSDTEDNNLDPDDIEDMNEVGDDGDDDADKTQLAGKMALEQIPNIDEIKLETDNIVDFSDEEDDDRWRYSSQSGKDTLAKFQSIARKLNKSPNSKALFVDICREKGCLKPHNVKRDVRT
ncbi:hypothetical protein MJO29_012689 [Puccinia striiformis f. sp. tritici]|nr:hypothetical protein MJO29_012689 [Puccinia striiformis f. sp. tritici]